MIVEIQDGMKINLSDKKKLSVCTRYETVRQQSLKNNKMIDENKRNKSSEVSKFMKHL